MKSESENLVENIRGYKNFKSADRKNKIEVDKFGRKNSVNWNHTDLIINYNKKYSDSIHVGPCHTDSNQPIPADSTNIGSIHGSADIRAIGVILASPIYPLVPASPIFTYGSTSHPPSPSHDSPAESVTPKGNGYFGEK